MQEIKKYVEKEHKRLLKHYGLSEKDIRYPMAIKIGEEVGELFEEILRLGKLQRKEKLEQDTNIGEEFADVILATMILAQNCGIDVEKSIHKKMEKIKKRYY